MDRTKRNQFRSPKEPSEEARLWRKKKNNGGARGQKKKKNKTTALDLHNSGQKKRGF